MKNATKATQEEIEYWQGVEFEDGSTRTEREAFDTVLELAEEGELPKSVLKNCRVIAIRLGIYRPMTQNEIDTMQVSSGSVQDFTLNGTKYIWKGAGR